jgi:hypothetical protein
MLISILDDIRFSDMAQHSSILSVHGWTILRRQEKSSGAVGAAAAGLRQVDVAERLGKPQSYVSNYESGERKVSECKIED